MTHATFPALVETTVAVLFARRDSFYKTLPGVDVWDEERDARKWPGGTAVVAHPPCRMWGRLRQFAKGTQAERELGIMAVAHVRKYGGVLEHPAESTLYSHCGLPRPGKFPDTHGGWSMEINQFHFGHRAEKATWFYVVGADPDDLPPIPHRDGSPTHCVRPTRAYPRLPSITKAEREHTPPPAGRMAGQPCKTNRMTHATFPALVAAYLDCRRSKRNSTSAMAFELHVERNLCALFDELASGTWQPGRSNCFVVTRPKPREVWAADFRDRIVHHLLYNHIAPRFHAGFIANSCACIPGRGTLYAGQRVEHAVRSITHNWDRPAFYLKCDLANFFVAIDKHVLRAQLTTRICPTTEAWWQALADTVLMHDPRGNVQVRGPRELLARVPPHKSLFNAPPDTGLPIGNLSSQFFANVHLDALDQFAKHQIKARHYVRYVDDFVLLHESPQWLHQALQRITTWLPERLGARLNPSKTILQPVDRGIDFVGHVVKPWRRTTRPRTLRTALQRIETMDRADLHATGNSYFGLLRQASHSHTDRVALSKALRYRGFTVDGDLTRIFRGKV